MNLKNPLHFIASKVLKLLVPLSCSIAITGCNNHHYTEMQLIGSWQLDANVADARVTYYTNHMWVGTVTSSDTRVPNGSEFGGWMLNGNHLETITYSTLNGASSDAKEITKIDSLNKSTMVQIQENEDVNSNHKKSRFHRIDAPCPLMADDDLTHKLTGTWEYSYTNPVKHAAVCLFSIYETNGAALWHGTMIKDGEELPTANAAGIWQVEKGCLFTTITNIDQKGVPINKESRDEIVFITDSEFIFRDDHGVVKKVLKQQSDEAAVH